MIDNILPDFTIPVEKPPITILRELAVQLGRKTHNLVKGEVYTLPLQGEQVLHGFEAREVQHMARRIAAIIALSPALDANYQAVITI